MDMGPLKPQCRHAEAVEVRAVDGELVAWWCEACETQLPADWIPADPYTSAVSTGAMSINEARTRLRRFSA